MPFSVVAFPKIDGPEDGCSGIFKMSVFEGPDRITVKTFSNASTGIFECFQAITTGCIPRRLSSESAQVMGHRMVIFAVGTAEVALVKLATAIFCTSLEPALSQQCVAKHLANSNYLDRTTITMPVLSDMCIFFDGLLTMTIWAFVKLPCQIAMVLGGRRGVIPRCKILALGPDQTDN